MLGCCEEHPLQRSITAPHPTFIGSCSSDAGHDSRHSTNATASAVGPGLGYQHKTKYQVRQHAHFPIPNEILQNTPLPGDEKRISNDQHEHNKSEMGCCAEKSCCSSKAPGNPENDVLEVSEASESLSEIAKFKDGISITSIDIENLASSNTEQIALNVQGMTCTGCEKSLQKALACIPGVSGIRTNLLLGQAEFTLQESKAYHVDNIAQIIESKTGFSCKALDNEGEELELVLPHHISKLSGDPPNGVLRLQHDGKHVRVSYNPRIIGARDLCSHQFFESAQLSPPSPPPVVAAGRAQFRKELCMTILSAILTIPVLVLAYAKLPKHDVLYGAISLVLATMVQLVVAREFYVRAFRTLIFSRMAEMDMLVVLSSTTAYVYSVVAYGFLAAGKPLQTGQFFETSTLLVTLIMVGRTIATFSRQSAVESISIESLQVQTAIILNPTTGKEQIIDARLLQYGDTFKVPPDTAIVTDGLIISGTTEVDESMVTGESTLILKYPGSSIIAGSLNHSGTILAKLTRLPSENTIKTISSMVDSAKSSKPKVQELADQVAGYFTYGILAVTTVVFIIWVIIGKTVRNQSTSTACINAMTFAISTLIVSCPCAIGLAVPMVFLIASNIGARHGLIFKTGESLEIARKVTHIVFDKTGTLTEGNLSVVEEHYFDNDEERVLPMLMGITGDSNHPVSRAIYSHLKNKGVKAVEGMKVTSIPGSGLEATYQNQTLRAGNPIFLSLTQHPTIQAMHSQALTTFALTTSSSSTQNPKTLAILSLTSPLRPSAIPLLSYLRSNKIAISLLSGDNAPSVHALATHLGIPKENTRAGYSPRQKAEYVSSLLSPNAKKGRKGKKEVVIFIGDGINDAPALSTSSIGISISPLSPSTSSTPAISPNNSGIAASAASILLLHPSLKPIQTLIELSKAFRRRVVFNFVWSVVYNLGAVLLAAGAFVSLGGKGGRDVRIEPMYAGLGECVSVVPVVLVAVGLRWVRF